MSIVIVAPSDNAVIFAAAAVFVERAVFFHPRHSSFMPAGQTVQKLFKVATRWIFSYIPTWSRVNQVAFFQ